MTIESLLTHHYQSKSELDNFDKFWAVSQFYLSLLKGTRKAGWSSQERVSWRVGNSRHHSSQTSGSYHANSSYLKLCQHSIYFWLKGPTSFCCDNWIIMRHLFTPILTVIQADIILLYLRDERWVPSVFETWVLVTDCWQFYVRFIWHWWHWYIDWYWYWYIFIFKISTTFYLVLKSFIIRSQ